MHYRCHDAVLTDETQLPEDGTLILGMYRQSSWSLVDFSSDERQARLAYSSAPRLDPSTSRQWVGLVI